MSGFLFDQVVDRTGTGSLKGAYTPEALREAGLPSFWGAEFDFPTCPAFSQGVMECARRGFYPFTLQTEDYNRRVCWWMEQVRGWNVDSSWIVPTHGTIFALATAIRLTVPRDGRLLILQPGYSRYAQAATRLGRQCSHCMMDYDAQTGRYRLNLAALEAAMADTRNKLLVFSNPNNPTGTILSREELAAIDALSRKYNTAVFCDEIFAETVRNGALVEPYGKIAKQDSLAITCTSLGKCMSLTGVNHANVLIPNEAFRERYVAQRYADHYGSIDPMLYAGLLRAYTPEGKAFVEAANRLFEENDRLFRETVERLIPGARVTPCSATFLAWVNYEGTGMTAEAVQQFLERALFLGDPGEEYHSSPYFYRYSLAMPTHMLQKALDHLEKTCHSGLWQKEAGEKGEVL